MLAITNLADEPFTVDLGRQPVQDGEPIDVFADRAYAAVGDASLAKSRSAPYGYRWIRLRRTIGDRAGSAVQRQPLIRRCSATVGRC